MLDAEESIALPRVPGRTAGELIDGFSPAILLGDPATPVVSVTFDSRMVEPGSLFVAIKGGYTDGHDFLSQALDAGATCALIDASAAHPSLKRYRTVLRVPDTRAALAHVATTYFGTPSRHLRVIGVTGTDGKTTTSHMIESICRTTGLETGLVGTVSVRIGSRVELHESRQTTPESLFVQGYLASMVTEGVDVAILEATSHGLALHRLDGCLFDIGVITNITHEHLDFHGSVEAYRLAKGDLLTRVGAARESGKLGVSVVNADDDGTKSVLPLGANTRIFRYSLDGAGEAELMADRIETGSAGSRFDVVADGRSAGVSLHLPGRYNVANALAAAGACLALGISLEQIADGLSRLSHVPGRMQAIDEGQPFGVVVDYAHTPEALAALLRELRPATSGRLMAVFGSAGERDIAKRPIQGRISVELADYVVFTSEDPRFEDPESIVAQIAAGAIEAGRTPGVHFDSIEDRTQAIRRVCERARAGDTVVLAGKGHEHSMIYGAEKRPWDEASVARAILRELGYSHAASVEVSKQPAR